MKFRPQEIDLPALAPEPTIWALRRNPRAPETPAASNDQGGSLYQHLFGYDPIELLKKSSPDGEAMAQTSAENPKLNIINPETNFAVMEIVSEQPADDRS